MNPSLRSLVRRVAPGPTPTSIDDAFVADVRRRLEPLVGPAGPGAPARRRQLDDGAITSLPPEAALDRAVDLLRRLFDAAAPR